MPPSASSGRRQFRCVYVFEATSWCDRTLSCCNVFLLTAAALLWVQRHAQLCNIHACSPLSVPQSVHHHSHGLKTVCKWNSHLIPWTQTCHAHSSWGWAGSWCHVPHQIFDTGIFKICFYFIFFILIYYISFCFYFTIIKKNVIMIILY